MRPETIDASAVGGGLLAAAWNFVAGGDLGTLLGAAAAALSVVVLYQRYRINKRQLDKDVAD
jgi:hypothetical protein